MACRDDLERYHPKGTTVDSGSLTERSDAILREEHSQEMRRLSLLKIQSEPDFESSSENRHRIDVLRRDGVRSEPRAAHPDRDRKNLRYIDSDTTAYRPRRSHW